MINRRRFLSATASAAVFARVTRSRAAGYDIVIKGGRVIDPSLGIDAVRDVAVVGGRIAAVETDIAAGGADVIDAHGKIVAPGLIDIHCHCRVKEMPSLVLGDGVTAFIDAGSQGADNIDASIAIAKTGPNLGRVLINIARTGITGKELMDISQADVAAARAAIARHRDMVVGIKARLSRDVAGDNDLEALQRAQDAAAPFNLPVMIHMGQTVSPLPKVLALLKRGDVVTHMYAPPPNGILDEDGRLLPEVLAARRRGVWFDFGNGRAGHIRWDVAERAMAQGFLPNTLSTDWNLESRTLQVFDLPTVMSKFLLLGMPLPQVIACVTVNASRTFDVFNDRGTLNVGAPADVAVMELRQGSFEFVDNYENKRTGSQKLVTVATVVGGKRAPVHG